MTKDLQVGRNQTVILDKVFNEVIFVFADFNECMQLPCRNGGTCKNLDGSFECICPEGYTGTLCTGGIPSLSVLSFSLFDQSNYYYSCTLTLIYLTSLFFRHQWVFVQPMSTWSKVYRHPRVIPMYLSAPVGRHPLWQR